MLWLKKYLTRFSDIGDSLQIKNKMGGDKMFKKKGIKWIGFVFLVAVLLVILINISTTPVVADKAWTCYYPEGLNILSTEFSTGGGDKFMVILEVFGEKDGKYVTYLDSSIHASGIFGLGRLTIPSRINYVPWEHDYIKLEK